MKFFSILLIASLSAVNIYSKEELKISKYFTLKDAIKSSTATRYKINNYPSLQKKENIIYTGEKMDKVRSVLKKDINITSWYRGATLNQKVRGAKNSQHKDGLAVDFRIVGSTTGIKRKLDEAGVSYDQLIYYPKQNRLHISFKPNKKYDRRQYLVKK